MYAGPLPIRTPGAPFHRLEFLHNRRPKFTPRGPCDLIIFMGNALLDLLKKKIRQIYAALNALNDSDLSSVQPRIVREADLANAASLLIANIACIKDHLKKWCEDRGCPFHGDELINSNKSVALVHDLWNVDKHAVLIRPPRSGCTPKLQNIETVLQISTGPIPGGGGAFWIDPRTGGVRTETSGEGTIQLALMAEIVDENGNLVGDFRRACEDAVDAWLGALQAAGVPLS